MNLVILHCLLLSQSYQLLSHFDKIILSVFYFIFSLLSITHMVKKYLNYTCVFQYWLEFNLHLYIYFFDRNYIVNINFAYLFNQLLGDLRYHSIIENAIWLIYFVLIYAYWLIKVDRLYKFYFNCGRLFNHLIMIDHLIILIFYLCQIFFNPNDLILIHFTLPESFC